MCTLEKNHFNVNIVEQDSPKVGAWPNTWKSAVTWILINKICPCQVSIKLSNQSRLLIIYLHFYYRSFILETLKHLVWCVSIASKHSRTALIWKDTYQFTQERRNTIVICVAKDSPNPAQETDIWKTWRVLINWHEPRRMMFFF